MCTYQKTDGALDSKPSYTPCNDWNRNV